MKKLTSESRLDFEKYLSDIDGHRDFKFDEQFINLACNLHQNIMLDYGFDFKNFFYDFFINSRKNNRYYVPAWYEGVIDSFQDFLSKSEICYHLDSFISAQSRIDKTKIEIEEIERVYKEKFNQNRGIRNFQDKKDYEDSLKICKDIIRDSEEKFSLSGGFLESNYSVDEIVYAVKNLDDLVCREGLKVEKALKGEFVEDKNEVIENPILNAIQSRKRAIAVCSGNFFGKSFLLATISIWSMLCHENIIVCSVVNADARKSLIKNQLLTQINEYMDGLVLKNGIKTNIFNFLFHQNVEEVFKIDMREKNYKVSAQKYGDTWRWYTKFARNALDTKGERPNKFIMMFDEASEIELGTIMGSLTNLKRDLSSLTFLILCGNPNIVPNKPVNEFVKYINSPHKYEKYVDVFHLKSSDLDLKILGSNQFVSYIIDTEGVDSPEFKERVMGEFIDTDCLIPRYELDKIFGKNPEPVIGEELIAGCDTALIVLQNCIRGEQIVWVGLDVAGNGKDSFGICIRTRTKILSCFTMSCRGKSFKPFYDLLGLIWSCRSSDEHIRFIVETNGNFTIEDSIVGFTNIPPFAIRGFIGHSFDEGLTSKKEREDCNSNYSILAKRRMCAWIKNKKLYRNEALKEEIAGMKLLKPETLQAKSKIDKQGFKNSYRKSPDLFDSLVHSFLLQRDYDILGKNNIILNIQKDKNAMFRSTFS